MRQQVVIQTKKRDEKGNIVTWSGTSEDGNALKVLVESGMVDGLAAKAVRAKFPMFETYAYGTLNSALRNARRALNKTIYHRSNGCKFPVVLCILLFLYSRLVECMS